MVESCVVFCIVLKALTFRALRSWVVMLGRRKVQIWDSRTMTVVFDGIL